MTQQTHVLADRNALVEAKTNLEALLKYFTQVPSTLADSTARGHGHAALKAIDQMLETSASTGTPVGHVATVVGGNLANRLEWATEEAHESTPVGTKLYRLLAAGLSVDEIPGKLKLPLRVKRNDRNTNVGIEDANGFFFTNWLEDDGSLEFIVKACNSYGTREKVLEEAARAMEAQARKWEDESQRHQGSILSRTRAEADLARRDMCHEHAGLLRAMKLSPAPATPQ